MFYIFISHLTATIVLLVTMCICNLVIDYDYVKADNPDLDGPEVFGKTLETYWFSVVASFIATVVSSTFNLTASCS